MQKKKPKKLWEPTILQKITKYGSSHSKGKI